MSQALTADQIQFITPESQVPKKVINKCQIETSLKYWEVVETPMQATVNGKLMTFDDSKVLVRSDNGQKLHSPKNSYVPYSNANFISICEQFAKVTRLELESIYEVAGGKKQLGYLKLDEQWEVQGHKFDDHLMIGNSHDGTTSFFVGSSNMMIRCENRFARELRKMKVPHSKNLHIGVNTILENFAEHRRYLDNYYEKLNHFATIHVDQSLIDSCALLMAKIDKEDMLGGIEELKTRPKNRLDAVYASFDREMTDLGQNVLGLFNGCTHYTTHKVKNHALDVELSMFDEAYKLNTAAMEFCEALI